MANLIWHKNLCRVCVLSEGLMCRSKWRLAEVNEFNCKVVTWNCPKVRINLQHVFASTLKDGVWWSVCRTGRLRLTVCDSSSPVLNLCSGTTIHF